MARTQKRPTGSIVDWRRRREAIAEGALPLYLERPWPNVSVEEIADRLGISYWQVYYSFDGQEDIYKAVVTKLVDRVAHRVADAPLSAPSVKQAIHNYVRHAADIISSEDYAGLLLLTIRDEKTDPWVRAAYQAQIAGPLREGLENTVARAGERIGLDMVILHGVPERCLTMLESALALPRLLRNGDFVDEHFERSVAGIAKEIWSSTCTFDGFAQQGGAAAA